MNEKWTVSINELVKIFRGSIASVVPWLEKAHIEWTDNDSYDDWDNICSVLFYNIVCSSLYSEVSDEYPIAKYSHSYNDYSDLDYIRVMKKEHPKSIFALISFISKKKVFDEISVAEINANGKVIDVLEIENKDIDFSFIVRRQGITEEKFNVDVLL